MTTATFKGGLTVYQGNTASPIAYTALEEVIGLGGMGTTNPLIDATSHESTAREYISGLADGSEISIECNRVHTASNEQDTLVTNVESGNTRYFKITLTNNSVSPILTKTYVFQAVCLSWNVVPAFDDKNTISFTLKITGGITIS